jgi:hypothetical protein
VRRLARWGALAAVLANLGAAEDPVPVRTMTFAERGPFLTVSVAMPELGDDALRKRLASGFVSTIVLRAYLYRDGEARPLGLTPRTYRIYYDLWDEVYRAQIQDPQGQLTVTLRTLDEAVAYLSKLEQFPLVQLASLPVGMRFFVAVMVEVNPVSPELLAQVRRWLAHPGSSERISGNEGFLGSFLSVFVNNQVSAAERVLRFRSAPFYRKATQKP